MDNGQEQTAVAVVTCPKCHNPLVHDGNKWKCEKSFATYQKPVPLCDYWEPDSGDNPDLKEAVKRVESRTNIKKLKLKNEVDSLFA